MLCAGANRAPLVQGCFRCFFSAEELELMRPPLWCLGSVAAPGEERDHTVRISVMYTDRRHKYLNWDRPLYSKKKRWSTLCCSSLGGNSPATPPLSSQLTPNKWQTGPEGGGFPPLCCRRLLRWSSALIISHHCGPVESFTQLEHPYGQR